ncbi:ABC transporter permease [Arthrobacter mangrovi]|uniref:Nitrate ABC transporter permease n=1 Tax=Arthrobacter mangrovi TaxID=2966350 RepID=A0ABQ5MZZ6_9MICC|nr:ABC transporter permease [Arthrobacter mangrovi]GLB69495.1 nitrate ABC transporter permease [Arthrobacter mangrovi]
MRQRSYLLIEIAVPVALIAGWWFVSANSDHPFWPPLGDMWEAFLEKWTPEGIRADVLPSLLRMAGGFLLATALGIAIGTAVGLSTQLRHYLDPVLQFLRAVPPPALIPVALLLFGLGDSGKIFLIVLGAVWPVVLSTEDGVRSVDSTLRDAAVVYRLSPWKRLRTVVLPSASPHIFAGVRTCLSISLLLMVISEMVAATNGLGHYIIQSQRTLDISSMWSGMFLLGILGYALTALFLLVQRRILRWHPDFRSGAGRN